MRVFNPPNMTHPRVAERLPGSVFTPAIAAWSSPGGLGGLPNVPVTGYVGIGLFLLLAFMRKIPWWAGIAGAGATWYFTQSTNAVTNLVSGTVISANGTTLQLSANTPAMLVVSPAGQSSVQIGNQIYPLFSTQQNPDGSTTYMVDNPVTAGV